MTTDDYRALVVDDEAVLRSHVSRALAREGFCCDLSADGIEAEQRLLENAYDLVVTDLRMPRRHGHSLVCEILATTPRPVVVVLTGVVEPRLAKDLLIRGVDDISFKPVDYATFAAKVKALVIRRERMTSEPAPDQDADRVRQARPERETPDEAATTARRTPVVESGARDAGESTARGGKPSRRPAAASDPPVPKPEAALDIYRMSCTDELDAVQIADAISRHRVLADEVIRLANSQCYNRGGHKVDRLDRAVIQIGGNRIGQLVLAANAVAALAPRDLPWLDVALFWKRGIAAGHAVELLVEKGRHRKVDDGLLLATTMYSIRRLILGAMHPESYQAAVRDCLETGDALVEHEARMFPRSTGEMMVELLNRWDVPSTLTRPLRYAASSYHAIAGLNEPLRTQAELIKLADLIARIALKKWYAWEWIEIPSVALLRRLRLRALPSVLTDTRTSAAGANSFETRAAPAAQPLEMPSIRLDYRSLCPASFDFLDEVLDTLGFKLNPAAGKASPARHLLVNALHAPDDEVRAWLTSRPPRKDTVLCRTASVDYISSRARAIAVPASVASLRTRISEQRG